MRKSRTQSLGFGSDPTSTFGGGSPRSRSNLATQRLERAQARIGQAAAELALADQNRWFAAALDNMPHGLCMFDGETRLILCNTAYRRMYDLPEYLTCPGTPLQDISPIASPTDRRPSIGPPIMTSSSNPSCATVTWSTVTSCWKTVEPSRSLTIQSPKAAMSLTMRTSQQT